MNSHLHFLGFRIQISWFFNSGIQKKNPTGIFGIKNGNGIPLPMGIPEIRTKNWNSQPRECHCSMWCIPPHTWVLYLSSRYKNPVQLYIVPYISNRLISKLWHLLSYVSRHYAMAYDNSYVQEENFDSTRKFVKKYSMLLCIINQICAQHWGSVGWRNLSKTAEKNPPAQAQQVNLEEPIRLHTHPLDWCLCSSACPSVHPEYQKHRFWHRNENYGIHVETSVRCLSPPKTNSHVQDEKFGFSK